MDLFKYENGVFEPAPSVLKTKTTTINNPSVKTLNAFGYWPKKDVEAPAEQEGYKVFNRGVKLEDDSENPGQKIYINEKYDVYPIVDEVPELGEDQEILRDYWDVVDNTWKHVYVVLNIVDPGAPELEEGQEVIDTDWDIDEAAGTKTKTYRVRKRVDNPPTLEEGQQIISDRWEDDGEFYTHVYEVRFVVDNPPELAENQEIIDDHWEDDGTTRTHVYEVRTIVDNPPELADNQFIYEDHWEDDGTTKIHVYDVWTLVDEKPAEEEGKVIRDLDFQDDPETKTRTHVYVVKTIVDDRPEDDPDGNFYFVFDHEEETDTEVIKVYRRVEKIWRVFSKLSIEAALFQMGKLDAFDTFIDSLEIENEFGQKVGLRRFYNQANTLKENHKFFKPYYAAALQALELTPEQGEALLEACIAEIDLPGPAAE